MTGEPDSAARSEDESRLQAMADKIADIGAEMGLPFIAVSADISDPDPMLDANGVPFAESRFRWIDPDLVYWKDRSFALRSDVLRTCRLVAEPFYLMDGQAYSWRHINALEDVDLTKASKLYGMRSSVVCPCHLPLGVIGAIVWGSDTLIEELPAFFKAHAEELHILALKFIATYRDMRLERRTHLDEELTRREIQCLKWAAAGKTDAEIAVIVGISAPTVRFHLTNASRKLGVSGRTQAIHRATKLGYVGAVTA